MKTGRSAGLRMAVDAARPSWDAVRQKHSCPILFYNTTTMATTPPIPHVKVPADQLVKGQIILFNGGVQETVRSVERQRNNTFVVITDKHPIGIVARVSQLITCLP